MTTFRLLGTTLLAALAASCEIRPQTDGTSPLARLGLVEAKLDRPLVSEAVAICNSILPGSDGGARFRASWESNSSNAAIPVYLVRSHNLAKADMVFVPEDDRIVIVNESRLRQYLDGRIKPASQSSILALMLLHEMGHIQNGDAGSHGGPEDFSLAALNTDNTAQKGRELLADEFAANQIRNAFTIGAEASRFSAGMKVASDLVVYKFDLSTKRLLNHFGDQTPRAFLDVGYSHPNYELRLLILLHKISPDEGTQQAIHDFEERRAKARLATPVMPLWKK